MPYRPSFNGLVERLNRKVLDLLRSFVQPTDTVWDLNMPQVMTSLNSQIQKSISETPHFVIFGSNKRLPYDLFTESPSVVYNLDDYLKDTVATFQKIHQRVAESLSLSKEDMIAYHNKNKSSFHLNVGDIVFSE